MAVGSEKVRVFVTLPAELLSRLEAEASAARVTKSVVIETLLSRHLSGFSADPKKTGSPRSEARDERTARLQREGREAQARRDALIGGGR